MRFGLIIALVLLGLGVANQWIRAHRLIAVSTELKTRTDAYPREYAVGDPQHPSFQLLVLGDSTASGTGTERVEETVAYLVAQSLAERKLYVRVRNLAAHGARLPDLRLNQITALPEPKADLALVMIGANDATHVGSLKTYGTEYAALTAFLAEKARHTVLVSTPNMQVTPAIPFPLNHVAQGRAHEQNLLLDSLVRKEVIKVDLERNAILRYNTDPQLYAPDLFHPSAKGYQLWAAEILRALG